MKLAPNFSIKEFCYTPDSLTSYQVSLLTILAANLQIVRNMLQQYAVDKKKAVSVIISSGVRTQADYDRLVEHGYNPSKTSDHFCGLQLLAKPTLGAADISVTNCSLSHKEITSKIIDMNVSGRVSFGQVIYEYNPTKKESWIHLGNNWEEILTNNIPFTRQRYLMSLDNGKTYTTFK